ncbi:MAG: hypothetical protein M3071_06475 [Actinomycetota bacterium]|nr:hypothetical protein [Actinomycetota bacterium]
MTEPSRALPEVLKEVLAALDQANVPEDLREVAFAKAFDHAAGAASAASPTGPASAASPPATTGTGGDQAADRAGAFARIADKLAITTEQAAHVFDIDEDGVHLTVPHSAFDSKKRTAMQQVMRIVAAARQAIDLEEFTATRFLRAACEDRGVLDSGNFSSALAGIDGDGIRVKGAGSSREIKLNAKGYAVAGEIVKQLAGEV